jgi:hypothetical protein
MESRTILERATWWANGRGWRHKLAKRRQYEQSLFEHSLIELDVLLAILPILGHRRHYGLDETERKILAVAVLAHDVGKETDEWQAYISGHPSRPAVSHVLPDLTRAVVPGLCGVLGFDDLREPVQRIMAHCAEFHHSRPGRSDGAIVEAMLAGGSDRFLTLAHLVKAIDHFCSAAGASEATECIRSDPSLGKHVVATLHEVTVRGVSTTLLHRGAQTAFERARWIPLLYFANATVYGADPAERPVVPGIEDVERCLKAEIDIAIARDVTSLMVGNPSANILPKPELLAFNESRQCLTRAAEKISPQSLAKKPMESKGGKKGKREIVAAYWKLKGVGGKPTDAEVGEQAGRLSVAQPEMLVFKFFKAMVDPDKLPVVGADGAGFASAKYQEVFGEGSWEALQSTSTLDPVVDMARTVDRYWDLPGKAVGVPQAQKVAELSDQTRLRALIDLLDGMAQEVYAATGRPAPRDEMSRSMAAAFLCDLVRPAATGDVREVATNQLDHYASSKPFAGKESARGVYFCPICNAAARDTVKASADFIAKPEAHTNRGVAHGPFGYVMVCRTCYYERVLFQVLLGPRPPGRSDPGDVITLLPRLNLGPGKGEIPSRGSGLGRAGEGDDASRCWRARVGLLVPLHRPGREPSWRPRSVRAPVQRPPGAVQLPVHRRHPEEAPPRSAPASSGGIRRGSERRQCRLWRIQYAAGAVGRRAAANGLFDVRDSAGLRPGCDPRARAGGVAGASPRRAVRPLLRSRVRRGGAREDTSGAR